MNEQWRQLDDLYARSLIIPRHILEQPPERVTATQERIVDAQFMGALRRGLDAAFANARVTTTVDHEKKQTRTRIDFGPT